jgi:hypothetical protein
MQHIHTGETGANDYGIKWASLLQLGVLIRHAFSDAFFIRYFPNARAFETIIRPLASLGN